MIHSIRNRMIHIGLVILMITAFVMFLSANTFAASSGRGKGQVNYLFGINLRNSPSLTGAVVSVLPDNTDIRIYREVFKSKKSTSKRKIWYYVKVNGRKGYVRADNIDNVRYKKRTAVVRNTVNVRKGPGISMRQIGTLKQGRRVKVYINAKAVKSVSGSSRLWYKVRINGRYGYVCSTHLEIKDSKNTDQHKKHADKGHTVPSFPFPGFMRRTSFYE